LYSRINFLADFNMPKGDKVVVFQWVGRFSGGTSKLMKNRKGLIVRVNHRPRMPHGLGGISAAC
jgi:hypothetical protein